MTLDRKGAIVSLKDNTYDITDYGIELLSLVRKVGREVKETKMPAYTVLDVDTLHKDIKEIMIKHTGHHQAAGFGRSFFVPALRDLQEYLLLFKRKYKNLWDAEKVRKAILAHTEKCARSGEFTPIIKYYIYNEEKGSPLAAVLDVGDVPKSGKPGEDFDIVETKNLFE